MAKTLIVRHHRIGDALIALPLIASLATKYKDDEFTVVSNKRFESIFKLMPENVIYVPMIARGSKGMFRGISFLYRRWFFIRKMKSLYAQFDKIAFLQYDRIDRKLHQFVLENCKDVEISIIDMTKFFNPARFESKFQDGMTSIDNYAQTLSHLGYKDLTIDFNISEIKKKDSSELYAKLGIDKSKKIIAVAPFSKEETKIYPLDKMEKVIDNFAGLSDQYQVVILGGGLYEKNIVDKWVSKYPNLISLIDRVSYEEEILLVAQAGIMLCMDSFNMHLAAFLQTPIVSIWGATVPEIGFYPAGQKIENAIVKRVDCQPCSFFGNKECKAKVKYRCLDVDPQIVIEKVLNVLNVKY